MCPSFICTSEKCNQKLLQIWKTKVIDGFENIRVLPFISTKRRSDRRGIFAKKVGRIGDNGLDMGGNLLMQRSKIQHIMFFPLLRCTVNCLDVWIGNCFTIKSKYGKL